MSATVAGAQVGSFAVSNGGTATLNVQTGKAVQLTSTGSVSWTTTLNGTALVPGASTATAWSGAFGTTTARTVTLTATSTADSAKVATVTINVAAGATYALPAPQVGAAATYSLNDIRNDNSTATSSYTDTTTAVNADGTYLVQRSVGGNLTRTFSNTAAGSRASQLFANGNLCTYTPARQYFSFPLFFGKSWSSSWSYSCALGYRENATLTGQVVAQESVTVPLGTFEALKIVVTVNYTGSNDGNLTGGNASSAQYGFVSTCWYGIAPVRLLGCDDVYNYTGVQPANYLKTSSYKRAS